MLHGVCPTGKEIGRGDYGRAFEVNYEGPGYSVPQRRYWRQYYNIRKGMTYKRSKATFLKNARFEVLSVIHACVVQFLGLRTH